MHFPSNSARYHPAAIAAPKTFNLGQRMCLEREAALYDYAAKCINSQADSVICILYLETDGHVLLPVSPEMKTKVIGAP